MVLPMALQDLTHLGLVKAVLPTELSKPFGLYDLSVGISKPELYPQVFAATSSLRCSIQCVVFRRPDKKMTRTDAWRIVAVVTNLHPLRDRANKALTRKPMSLIILATLAYPTVTVRID
jgi:hypothetical protein